MFGRSRKIEALETGSKPMSITPTTKLYLKDDYCFETDARITVVRDNLLACDQTCFYPGGGGQPPDKGVIKFADGEVSEIESAFADSDQVIWHVCKNSLTQALAGESIKLILNPEKRLAHMRYHTALHVLNTITLREYGGWITGVQINADHSRIDFKLDGFSASLSHELEEEVNLVLQRDHPLKSYSISEEEFRRRDDLLRTLEAKPPSIEGKVRVVEIEGFEAQACGGTHVHNTGEVGRFSIYRIDNKGKNNKRFYVRLDPPD
jgi:misacylated tRNA(Ala) deacylase